jgi:hypothetical protein
MGWSKRAEALLPGLAINQLWRLTSTLRPMLPTTPVMATTS